MSLLTLVLVIVVVGVLLWAINRFLPMEGSVKQLLNIVVLVCLVIWVLSAFGLFHHLDKVTVPQLR